MAETNVDPGLDVHGFTRLGHLVAEMKRVGADGTQALALSRVAAARPSSDCRIALPRPELKYE